MVDDAPLLLAFNISLITNNKINYSSVVTLVLLLLSVIVIGVHLWMSGIDFLKSASILWKIAGGVALLAAVSCILFALGLGYWECMQLIDFT